MIYTIFTIACVVVVLTAVGLTYNNQRLNKWKQSVCMGRESQHEDYLSPSLVVLFLTSLLISLSIAIGLIFI